MMKKLILTCLITVCMSNMLGMEQSSTDSLSSLPKDFMEELPIDYLSALPKEIKKIVILDLGTVKGIRSLLETNKENAKLCNDPLILSHLLSLIFKMDDTTREDIRLFLEAHKDNGILLNDPMIIGFLTTKIAEPYAREAHNKKISEGFAPDFGDPFFDEIHSDRYLNRFSVPAKLSSKDLIKDALKQKHVELIGDKNAYVGDALRWRSHEETKLGYYDKELASRRIKVAIRLGTEGAAKWLKEFATNDEILKPSLIQLLIQDYFFTSIAESKVENVKFLLKTGVNDRTDRQFANFVQKMHRDSLSKANTEIAEMLAKTYGIALNDSVQDLTDISTFLKDLDDTDKARVANAKLNEAQEKLNQRWQKQNEFYLSIQQFKNNKVLALIEEGVDIGAKDHLGNTPLMTAILCGNWKIALTLIEKGANLSAVNKKGQTALELAKQQSNNKMVNGARAKIFDAILAKIAKASDADGSKK